MALREAYIVDGVRTPIGNFAGSLSSVRADDLAAFVISELISRHPEIDTRKIDDCILGCANQAGEDNRNVARMAALLAGLPVSVPGQTVNRLCASGMSAVVTAAASIYAGFGDLFIAGGVEQMTRAPYVLSKSDSAYSRNAQMFDTSMGWRFINSKMQKLYGTESMGETAENLAREYKISREEQDRFALLSQQKATKARESGRLALEIKPMTISKGKSETLLFEHDEFIKAHTTLEGLGKLKPAFKNDELATVSAGNSSGINDGACALIIASERAVKEFKLKPKARLLSASASGVEPRVMGLGPVSASRKVLEQSSLKMEQMNVIEINEAFAAQVLACLHDLNLDARDSRINPNGGAIALGHPLGASGARLILSATEELCQRGERYALCSMCVGVGQGTALILERVG